MRLHSPLFQGRPEQRAMLKRVDTLPDAEKRILTAIQLLALKPEGGGHHITAVGVLFGLRSAGFIQLCLEAFHSRIKRKTEWLHDFHVAVQALILRSESPEAETEDLLSAADHFFRDRAGKKSCSRFPKQPLNRQQISALQRLRTHSKGNLPSP
jgi:hypothetical protein